MPRYSRDKKPPLGVFAYLPNPTNTTTTLAGTYYPITGPFTNPILEQFTVGVNYIEFSNHETVYVKIIYSGTFESDTNNTTITAGIKLNGTLITGSEGAFKLKAIGDSGGVSATVAVEITSGDQIQLVIKSDQAGAVITCDTFTTSLNRFMVQ